MKMMLNYWKLLASMNLNKDMKTITWNGWTYVQGKKSYWKERHNQNFKNFVEKIIISQDEFLEAANSYAKIFK